MKNSKTFFWVPLALLSSCAHRPKLPPDYMGAIRTQTSVTDMATCIGQAVAVAPAATTNGFVVDAPNAQPPRRYTVIQDKIETVVTVQGGYGGEPVASDVAAVKCAIPPR